MTQIQSEMAGRLLFGTFPNQTDGPAVKGKIVEDDGWLADEMFELTESVTFVSPHDGSTVTWKVGERIQLDMVHFL